MPKGKKKTSKGKGHNIKCAPINSVNLSVNNKEDGKIDSSKVGHKESNVTVPKNTTEKLSKESLKKLEIIKNLVKNTKEDLSSESSFPSTQNTLRNTFCEILQRLRQSKLENHQPASPYIPLPVAETLSSSENPSIFDCCPDKKITSEEENVSPNFLLNSGFLKKIIEAPLNVETVEDDDFEDDEEIIEYKFIPRHVFNCSICEFCKVPLKEESIGCFDCSMTFYCSIEHMRDDKKHEDICSVLDKMSSERGGHIYNEAKHFNADDFRTFRVMLMNECEQELQRPLVPYEREIILFPKICVKCREWQEEKLIDCSKCGQVTYCKGLHFPDDHEKWCDAFILLREFILYQEKHGKVDPDLPEFSLKEPIPVINSTIEDVMKILKYKNENEVLFTTVTQIASAPLTVWYGLKLAGLLNLPKITIHLIGAEVQYEIDVMQKWELFLVHLNPCIKELNIVFVGPELFPKGFSQDALRYRTCNLCRQKKRLVHFYFEESLYHDYYSSGENFMSPDLICFFNPGLHRKTGFNLEDSWADTLKIVAKQKIPTVVTSYTHHEAVLDFRRLQNESDRVMEVIVPPAINPFASRKPDRNFISDEVIPLVFKNYYLFAVR